MADESDYYPSPVPVPATATPAEFIAALNQVRDAVHQARMSRHSHQSRVAGIVSGIQSELIEATDRYARELADLKLAMTEVRTALSGGTMGAQGINAQIAANNAQISSLAAQVSALAASVHDCREDSERRHLSTDASIRPLIEAQKRADVAPRWYTHPAAIACMCAIAISALAKSGPAIGAIVAGAK